jgi:hypothetical protein
MEPAIADNGMAGFFIKELSWYDSDTLDCRLG